MKVLDAAPPSVDRPRVCALSATVGLLAVGLGAVVHTLSGGSLPALPILGALAIFAVLAATLAGRARVPGWCVLLLLGAGQQVLHWLLGGLADGAVTPAPDQAVHHDGTVPVGSAAAPGHSPEVMLMLHTHLAVALLLGWAALRWSGLRARLERSPRLERRPERAKGAPVE
ncbi:hypothetical protein [Arthrobacter antioxidans]|uniref:hypothetical protein n=1 Tax=Arthrobacter antioxidans TaxID=2895818 RepID=UPI001FFFCCFD|nr:hypothetical protein [Arthrobacter antioxidans]